MTCAFRHRLQEVRCHECDAKREAQFWHDMVGVWMIWWGEAVAKMAKPLRPSSQDTTEK